MTIIHIKAAGSIPLSQFASAAASSMGAEGDAPLLSTCEAYAWFPRATTGTWTVHQALRKTYVVLRDGA